MLKQYLEGLLHYQLDRILATKFTLAKERIDYGLFLPFPHH